jgi:hypothetical protein
MKDVVGVWGACSFLWLVCLAAASALDYSDRVQNEETDSTVAFSAPACYPEDAL